MDTLINVYMHCDRTDLRGAMMEVVLMAISVLEGGDPEEVLHDERFEPDYVFDLLEWTDKVGNSKAWNIASGQSIVIEGDEVLAGKIIDELILVSGGAA